MQAMRVALLTPLPPTRTGVAHYASMLLPALREQLDVEAFSSLEGYRRGEFDAAVYQLGNNPHHEFVYREAMEHPGVAVLHDLVLHHLVVEMTLARGDVEGYVDALRANHGEAGAAWARGRAAGLHSEMGNFLLPASVDVANRSRAVIVHNTWAAAALESLGVTTPVHVIPHPYVPGTYPDRGAIRARLGLAEDARVIGLFGFLTSAKRSDVVLRAFADARSRDRSLQLLVVGEPAPNIDVASLAAEGITFTGYVADDDFAAYYAAVDRLVNLRYPSAGESSGTLIRAFDAGKPVAVSDYAQFAELPNDCVTKIAFGDGEADALSDFFTRPLDEAAIARAQRQWLDANARLDLTAAG
jgi:glycosyltransferase involved in cell wall biosynthesis